MDLTRKVSKYQDRLNFKEEFPLQKFLPGHYRIKVALMDGESELLTEWEKFDITSVSVIPRPWVYYKKLLPPSDPVYSFILGRQLFSKGEIEKARVKFEIAFQKRPNSLDYALGLARAYFALKKYYKTEQILLPFSESTDTPYQVYFLLGKSHQALGEFNQAVSIYNKTISHFGINFNLLNSLGECYYKLEVMDEALASWEKSLEINPNQAEIKKKIETIKK